MRQSTGVVCITGATGYVGAVLLSAFAAAGWRTIALVRAPQPITREARVYDLTVPVDANSLDGLDVLVHCAYDMALTSRRDIWEVNVAGTERLLAAARAAGVHRVIVVSSIAAYQGTRQLYGQAKLAIEEAAHRYGAIVIRPGLVFGPNAGGTLGALRKSVRAGVVPLFAGHSHQYLIHEDDLAEVTIRLAAIEDSPSLPVVVAGPEPVSTADILRTLARADSRPLILIPFPWRLAYGVLRVSEALRVRLPFRADSLWGLAHPPPPPSPGPLRTLGLTPRRFTVDALSSHATFSSAEAA